jgi:predicted unusual protein kinase regulating ubiquinone biosynthesis (AarF/ABC1/UbiB family)
LLAFWSRGEWRDVKQSQAFVRLRRGSTVAAVFLRHLVLPYLLRRSAGDSGAKRLRLVFETLGGAWLKLGQVLALRFDLLPEAYCYELFGLLCDVEPTSYARVRAVIREELSDYPERLFATFCEQPFASASIGQVHRAVMYTGQEVAVKVQHPDAARLVRADISLIYMTAALLSLVRSVPGALTRGVIDELSRWTEEELDFRLEAKHATTLQDKAVENSLQKIPKVYWNLSSARVLTLEYIRGVPLITVYEAVKRGDEKYLEDFRAAGHDLDRIAENITHNALNQIYRDGYFHADMHPANLYVLEGDAIAYVDFGIVGELPEETRRLLMSYATLLYLGHVDRAADLLFRWVKPSKATDVHVARDELIGAINAYLMDRGVHTKSSRESALDVLDILRRHHLEISSEIAMYLKALITVATVTEALSPVAEINRIQKKFFQRMFLRAIPSFLASAGGQPRPWGKTE